MEQLQQAVSYKTKRLSRFSTAGIKESGEGLESFSVRDIGYDGLFTALLDAIETHITDIFDIRLSGIVEQYLLYVAEPGMFDFQGASSFLMVLSYLLEMKSKLLLPVEEDAVEEEIETSLVDHLEQYKLFKSAAAVLKERKDMFARIFHRAISQFSTAGEKQFYLRDVGVTDLVDAFRKVYLEAKEPTNLEIVDELVTVEEKIADISQRLMTSKNGMPFESLFKTKTKLEVVVTFLAVLELIRARKLVIKQEQMFGNIVLFAPEGPGLSSFSEAAKGMNN